MTDENVKEEMLRIQPQLIGQIQPGDTIVLRYEHSFNPEQVENIADWMKEHFPGVEVIILELGMSIEVYRKKEETDAQR